MRPDPEEYEAVWKDEIPGVYDNTAADERYKYTDDTIEALMAQTCAELLYIASNCGKPSDALRENVKNLISIKKDVKRGREMSEELYNMLGELEREWLKVTAVIDGSVGCDKEAEKLYDELLEAYFQEDTF